MISFRKKANGFNICVNVVKKICPKFIREHSIKSIIKKFKKQLNKKGITCGHNYFIVGYSCFIEEIESGQSFLETKIMDYLILDCDFHLSEKKRKEKFLKKIKENFPFEKEHKIDFEIPIMITERKPRLPKKYLSVSYTYKVFSEHTPPEEIKKTKLISYKKNPQKSLCKLLNSIKLIKGSENHTITSVIPIP